MNIISLHPLHMQLILAGNPGEVSEFIEGWLMDEEDCSGMDWIKKSLDNLWDELRECDDSEYNITEDQFIEWMKSVALMGN